MDLSTFMYIGEGAKVRYDGENWTVKRVDHLNGKLVLRNEDGETERVHYQDIPEVKDYA